MCARGRGIAGGGGGRDDDIVVVRAHVYEAVKLGWVAGFVRGLDSPSKERIEQAPLIQLGDRHPAQRDEAEEVLLVRCSKKLLKRQGGGAKVREREGQYVIPTALKQGAKAIGSVFVNDREGPSTGG